MFLVDSHCHLDRLDLTPFDGKLEGALQHAKDNGVGHMLCVAISMENFPDVKATADNHDYISASVGVHPNEQGGHDPSVDELVEIAQDNNIVAIGDPNYNV